jgi:hypothetical protein
MTYHGTVRNGVVVLEEGVNLPEGISVEVQAPPVSSAESVPEGEVDIFDFGRLAVDTGIPDLAINHDHYLYGHPKVSDGQ